MAIGSKNYQKVMNKAASGMGLPKAQNTIGDAFIGNTTFNPSMDWLPEKRSWLGRQAARIGNIFRPSHLDVNPYFKDVLLNPTPPPIMKKHEGIHTPIENTPIDPTLDLTPEQKDEIIDKEVEQVVPDNVAKKGTEIGSSNYRQALKNVRRGR